jgi:hypothetical protein
MIQSKSSEMLSQQVNAIYRVLPVTALGELGSNGQELASKTAQLVQGREYQAQVLSKLSNNDFLVKVSGNQVQDLTLKMELGGQAKVGQSLALEYLHNSPTLTFLLKQSLPSQSATNVNLSHIGSQLGQYIQQAEAQGVPTRFQAVDVVTHNPIKPQIVAHDLQQAVARSGLFYESHLQEFTQGKVTLNQLKHEPQNQAGFSPATHMFQQLAVLENQRLSWHGEIWPGQMMTWDVYEQHQSKQSNEHEWNEPEQSRPIASELTIDFPSLGKVTAKLSIVNGHIRIGLIGEQTQTLQAMQKQKHQLAEALTKNGQQLDALTVSHHEPSTI